MGIFDRFLKEKTKLVMEEIGAPGTEFFSGFISEEFNPDLRDKNGIDIFDKMRKNDAQVYASLQAVKLPLLQARWYIEPATDEEPMAEEQALFVEKLIFEKLNWKTQLKKIITYLDFGFKYLEKVYEIDDKGRVVWKKWADRQQTAHLSWSNDNNTLVGAQQQLPTGNIIVDDKEVIEAPKINPFIPMDKLLLFTYQREGTNYQGTSILRAAYKHWWFKDTLYKIEGISAERYGVGIPWIQLGDNNSDQDKNKAEELGRNLRSNETSYLVTPGKKEDGMNVEILTPSGDPKASSIREAIDHHNKMITMNVLASFLDLGGGSGSYALSKDQSAFFLMGLQAIADEIKEVVNNAIKELILLNYPNTKEFPTLEIVDIGNEDKTAIASSLNTLANAGLLETDNSIKDYIREFYKLPYLDHEEFEKTKQKFEPFQKEDEEKKDDEENKEEDEAKMAEKKKMISKRELAFMRMINENERVIQESYKIFEEELAKTESTIKTFLSKKYDKAETRVINGVVCIKSSAKLYNEIKSGVNDIMKKFQNKISGGTLSRNMMKNCAKLAILANKDLENLSDYATLVIPEGQVKSFMGGHISNMDGVVFNEGRHILEKAHDNIFQEVSVVLSKNQIKDLKFNRNIFRLSVEAHPRGLFRSIIDSQAQSRGTKYFKVVVPASRVKDITPSGKTAAILFMILTAQQLNKRGNVKGNADSVGGIGIHHGSFEMYYPMDIYDDEEEALAEEQRREFINSIQ